MGNGGPGQRQSPADQMREVPREEARGLGGTMETVVMGLIESADRFPLCCCLISFAVMSRCSVRGGSSWRPHCPWSLKSKFVVLLFENVCLTRNFKGWILFLEAGSKIYWTPNQRNFTV